MSMWLRVRSGQHKTLGRTTSAFMVERFASLFAHQSVGFLRQKVAPRSMQMRLSVMKGELVWVWLQDTMVEGFSLLCADV